MKRELEYDSSMRWVSASVAALALVAMALTFPRPIYAQIHGTPASVTSPNFGGHFSSAPGVPASVTSLGPRGYAPNGQFFHQPNCCINPLFPVNPNPPVFSGRHHRGNGFPIAGSYLPYYAVPYTPVVVVQEPEEEPADNSAEDEYRGGPTIFDRRGPGTPARPPEDEYAGAAQPPAEPAAEAPEPPPAEDQPETVLVFKDGRQLEVQNYAIVGSDLYDLTPGRHHKIALAELDLAATAKQNDDRGVDFRVPVSKD
jgi:hypothetical protein